MCFAAISQRGGDKKTTLELENPFLWRAHGGCNHFPRSMSLHGDCYVCCKLMRCSMVGYTCQCFVITIYSLEECNI